MTDIEKVARANCRGSWALGTACGKCPRCEATRPAIDSGMDAATVQKAEWLWTQLPILTRWHAQPTYVKALVCRVIRKIEADAKAAIAAMQPAPQWQGIESAPRDRNILVWFDHDADPYQDPQEPHKLTPYASWAEGGEYMGGKGYCIAKWHPGHFETEDEYGNGYWMPAAWFAYQNGDWEVVCNPTHWMPLPTPPAGGSDAE